MSRKTASVSAVRARFSGGPRSHQAAVEVKDVASAFTQYAITFVVM